LGTRAVVARTLRTVLRAVEGAWRPGPYYLPMSGGWLPAGVPTNWWQCDYQLSGGPTRSAMVEACVSAYSQTVAMCPGDHWRANNKGGRERVKNSALSRILRRPNSYQSFSDFILNAVRSLYCTGNAYALALRNDRYEVNELHLMDPNQSAPQVAETGDIFYRLAGNAVIDRQLPAERQLIVPQRDVLHIRLHADRRYPYPLIGETPLVSALSDIVATDAITEQQINFYKNQARPSAVLSTDLTLSPEDVEYLKTRWAEESVGMAQGKTPILTSGLKVLPWTVGGKDAEIAEMMKISNEHIALVFRVPLQILGLGGPTFGSTEALMQFWISTGLGFALANVESAFDRLFGLRGEPDEYTEFNSEALLRSAMKDRIEALARGVQGGIFSPNEARNSEGFDSGEAGDEPRVQQQVIPLSFAGKLPPAPRPQAPPAAAPAPPVPKVYDVRREAERIRAGVARVNRRLD
jgi:HK97 family phage portal protein